VGIVLGSGGKVRPVRASWAPIGVTCSRSKKIGYWPRKKRQSGAQRFGLGSKTEDCWVAATVLMIAAAALPSAVRVSEREALP